MSRPINDLVFPRLNIARPLAPHSVPLRRSDPALLSDFFRILFCFACCSPLHPVRLFLFRRFRSSVVLLRPVLSAFSVYCIHTSECQPTVWESVLSVKTCLREQVAKTYR